MKTLIEKKYLNIGFAAGLLILLAINIITYVNTFDNLDDEKLLNSSGIISTTSEMMISSLAESESYFASYLLTDSSVFIKRFNNTKNELDFRLKLVSGLTRNNKEEKSISDSISFLLSERNNLIKEALSLIESGDRTKLNLFEIAQESSSKYESIKKLLLEIKSKEELIIKQKNTEAEDNAKRSLFQIAAGTVIGFILIIAGIVFLNRNLKRRIDSERALEDSRRWFYITLKSIGDGVIVTNRLGDITFMNFVAQELTGWTENEAKGVYLELVYNVINEDTRKRIENPVSKVFKSGKTVDIGEHTLLISKEGKEIPIDDSASPIYNDEGYLTGIILVFKDISERRRAELEISRNQIFIKRIAESIPNILYVYEPQTMKLIYANPKINDMMGYSFEKAQSMGIEFFEKVIHPEDLSKFIDRYKQFEENTDSRVLENEYRIKGPEGGWRWLRSYDVVFSRNQFGLPVQILGTALDITEKKHLEEQIKKYNLHLEELVEKRTSELKRTNEKLHSEIFERARAEGSVSEAEEKFQSLVEHSLVGIYIIQNGKFVYVNPKFEEAFGYNENELNNRDVLELVHPDYAGMVRENIRKRLENALKDSQYTFKAIRKDGSVFDVEVRGTTMNYEGKIAIIGTLQDITERKKAEDTLKEHEEFLNTVVNSAPNLIYVKDRDGKFVLVNKAAAEYYSMEPSEIIGKTEAELGKENEADKIFAEDLEVMNSSVPMVIPEEKFVNNTTGLTSWMQIIKVPILTHNRNRQVLCILTDITARKGAEENIIKSLQEKELLLQEIHHRVKNNLQIVISLLKLQSKYIFDKRDFEIFNKSRARVETMSLIHEKLYKSADLENIDLGNYLKDLTNQLLKAYGMDSSQVTLCVNSENVRAGIDTAIPCGLIANELVSNSLKHAFRINQIGNISINIKKEDKNIIFTITDDGVGLPPNFDIENTDSLGLQLVTTLARQLDGEIKVDSSRNGTVFSLTFPEIKYKERMFQN